MDYQLRLNKRSRSIRITVRPDGSVFVSAPKYAGIKRIKAFVYSKESWIKEKQEQFKKFPSHLKTSKTDYRLYKGKALDIALERIKYFNRIYNFKVGKVTIRNQKTRWGSCSRKGNLNFSYRIAILPTHLADYIIVHELCHLREFNHSKNFWQLVAVSVPEYLKARLELRKGGWTQPE